MNIIKNSPLKRFFLIWTFSSFFILNFYCQSYEWSKVFIHDGDVVPYAVLNDSDNNIIMIGEFEGAIDFDPGPDQHVLHGTYGSRYILKLNSSGEFEWVKKIEWSIHPIYSVTIDVYDNLLFTGTFESPIDFDPGPGSAIHTSNGFRDIFIVKLDSLGDYLWSRTYGNSGMDEGGGITADRDGNIYCTGEFAGPIDFDPGPNVHTISSQGYQDVYVLKLDQNGNFIWVRRFGGHYHDKGQYITTDSFGNVITKGFVEDNGDLDPGTGVAPFQTEAIQDHFIHKMDSSGNFIWGRTFFGDFHDFGQDLKCDRSDNIIFMGSFFTSADVDPSADTFKIFTNGQRDVFFLKLSAEGNFKWAKVIGGINDDRGYNVSIDSNNNIYSSGYFSYGVDVDPGPDEYNIQVIGYYDAYIHKMDSLGNFIWVKSIGSPEYWSWASFLSLDKYGNIYRAGNFMNTTDLNPGPGTDYYTAYGNNQNMYLQKFGKCTSMISVDTVEACNYYVWINGQTYDTSNYSASYSWINSEGCDSTRFLYLTVNPFTNISTHVNGATITADNGNASYRWLNCNSSYSQIIGATGQNFSPSENGSYAVEITENDCIDTSDCVTINSVGLTNMEQNYLPIVYPNPSFDNFSIKFDQQIDTGALKVYDVNGKLILAQTIQNSNVTHIDHQLNSGLYLLEIVFDDRINYSRIVVTK